MCHITFIAALVFAAHLVSSLAVDINATLPVPAPASSSFSFQAVTNDANITGQWAFTGAVEDAFVTLVDDTSYATDFVLSQDGYLQLASNSSFYANINTAGTSQVVFFNSKAAIDANGWKLLGCEKLGLLLHCCADGQSGYLNKFYLCPSDWAVGGALVIAQSADAAGSACTPLQLRSGPRPLKFGEVGAGISPRG